MDNILLSEVEKKIITLRNQQVILDSDVAELYGVQTKEVNQAVKNHPKKFIEGYIWELTSEEIHSLRSNFLTLKKVGRGNTQNILPKHLLTLCCRAVVSRQP